MQAVGIEAARAVEQYRDLFGGRAFDGFGPRRARSRRAASAPQSRPSLPPARAKRIALVRAHLGQRVITAEKPAITASCAARRCPALASSTTSITPLSPENALTVGGAASMRTPPRAWWKDSRASTARHRTTGATPVRCTERFACSFRAPRPTARACAIDSMASQPTGSAGAARAPWR